jgi:hypothetical protein
VDPSLTPPRLPQDPAARATTPPPLPIARASDIRSSKPRANFEGGLAPLWLRYCIAAREEAEVYDANDVPSVPEPHGPDGTVADGGRGGTEISQPGAAGGFGQAVRAARRRARTYLPLHANLYPAGLRHRQGDGRQPRIRDQGRGCLCDPVRLAAALQEGRRAGAAPPVAGGADVRPFRHAVARHREDAVAGPRRLHHRLAQPARHSAQRGPVRAGGLHRPPHRLPEPARASRARGRDLPTLGLGAGGGVGHVGGRSSGAAGDAGRDRSTRGSSRPRSTNSPRASRSNGSRTTSSITCPYSARARSVRSIPVSCSSRRSSR